MENKIENGILTIFLEGNVDSNNAEEVGKNIDEIRSGNVHETLVLDLEKLNYISSAGLRQILRLKKQESDFKIINVSSEVYEIFDMTGFAEMIDIQKAYRKFDVEGCEVIGSGSNGIVYRINPDTIIKVYRNSDALDEIKRERELAKTALVLGINTAIPFDVVMVGDKYGSMFELLSAKSLTKLIVAEPENLEKYVHIFVDLLKEIHNTPVKAGLLPDAKQRAIKWAHDLNGVIDDEHYNKLIRMLEEVPESLMMIHGDYHTNNVHYDGKEAILIDMDTLSTGNPVFELSNVFLAYHGFGEINHANTVEFLHMEWDLCQKVLEKTFAFYFDGQDSSVIESAKHKAYTVGYTRLLRRTLKREKDNQAMIDNCMKRIIEEMDATDDLII